MKTPGAGKLIAGIRWALVAPSAVLGFYVAFFGTFFTFEGLNNWCPGGEVISGMCSAPYASWIFWGSKVGGAISAPFLVVSFGSLMAPSRRSAVAWTIFGLGLCVALRILFPRRVLLLIIVALAGAAASWMIQRRERVKLDGGTA